MMSAARTKELFAADTCVPICARAANTVLKMIGAGLQFKFL